MTASEAGTTDLSRREDRTPVIEVVNVSKRFALEDSLLSRLAGTRTHVQAVTDVSLAVYEGETLGLVGESGSGKSTLANVIAGLYTPTSGEVRFDGEPVGHATERKRELLSDVGMVFQNPRASLDPRMTVENVIAEPLRTQGWDKDRREARVAELIDLVELSDIHRGRYPHELSGGQAQRVAIARAVAPDPRVLLLDEPVSALDVSVQAKILNLLADLQAELGLTYLLIAHDLSMVEHMADRIAVMYLGRLMEVGGPEQLFENPTHPYTRALLSAIPSVDPRTVSNDRILLEGDIPSPVNVPSGCVFHTRCPVVIPPEDWSGDQASFKAAFTFRNRVLAGDVSPEESGWVAAIRERSARVVSGLRDRSAGVDRFASAVGERLRARAGPTAADPTAAKLVEEALPGDVADLPADAASRVEAAAEALVAGDGERAKEIVRDAFPSPCERQIPRDVEVDGDHTVACHRSDPEVLGGSMEAPPDRLLS